MKGFISPEYFLRLIKEGKNPEQLMLDFLQRQMADTPIGNNLISLAKNKNGKEIEQFARNYMRQQGKDFDKEFNAFRQLFGL